MARDVVDGEVIETRDALAAWFEAGAKRDGPLRVGTEHEKILFYRAGHAPVPYAGATGIAALLEGMNARLGWERIEDDGALIGLYDDHGGEAISLEPGGQFELSGAPSLGMSPKWTLAETPIMPKSRYEIMRRYMPKVGSRGLDMMFRTATVQTNFDFRDERDMVTKLRVAVALQPAITAMFANSPFTDGKLNGFLSARSEIWRDTDPARTGTLPFAFEPGMGFERYVDYALDVPMYFLKRGQAYIDVAGASFRDLLDGRLAAAPGERATIADWANHLSTIFPEVRLKRYLEMRGADVGPPDRIVAMTALTAGLFYDPDSLSSAAALVEDWTAEDRQALRDAAPRLGFAATIRGRTLRDVAVDMVTLARQGLVRRARRNDAGEDEAVRLAPLEAIVAAGRSSAEVWIERFEGPWRGSVEPAFEEATFRNGMI